MLCSHMIRMIVRGLISRCTAHDLIPYYAQIQLVASHHPREMGGYMLHIGLIMLPRDESDVCVYVLSSRQGNMQIVQARLKIIATKLPV